MGAEATYLVAVAQARDTQGAGSESQCAPTLTSNRILNTDLVYRRPVRSRRKAFLSCSQGGGEFKQRLGGASVGFELGPLGLPVAIRRREQRMGASAECTAPMVGAARWIVEGCLVRLELPRHAPIPRPNFELHKCGLSDRSRLPEATHAQLRSTLHCGAFCLRHNSVG